MNKIQAFQEFLATQSVEVPLFAFAINLFLAALLCFILSRIYIRYGTSLSNRRMFSRNFVILGMTTMLIITIVKSSLALSLGLVGALSIVRFRAAIKEPEELSYLFLTIAIGLGLGADQRIITSVAFVIICGVIMLRKRYYRIEDNQNLYLSVTGSKSFGMTLEGITEILKKYCSSVNMKRFDETEKNIEASFLLECEDFARLAKAKSELQGTDKTLKITFMDNKGII